MKVRRHPLLVGLLAAAIPLGACSNPGANAKSDNLETVTVAVNGIPAGLTASKWGGSASHVVLTGLGSQLLAYNLGATPKEACENPAYSVKGRLADSVEFNAAGTAVIFKLKDLTSQWGNKLSAEDVKWSFETGMVRDSVMKGALKSAGFNTANLVTIIDSKTVQLNLASKYSFSITALQQNLFDVYDSTEAKKHITSTDLIADDWLSNNLADYSGWKLENFTPGSSLVLAADPQWGGERGPVKKLVVNAVPNVATRAQLMTSGEAQIANGFSYDQYPEFAKDAKLRVQDCASLGRDTMMLNTTAKELKDAKVRQALSMAIDRKSLVEGAYTGFGKAATGTFPPLSGAASYNYDPDRAKKMLAEAGYPDGFNLTLSYGTSRPGPVAEKSAVLIKSQLAKVGIKVELHVIASATDLTTVLQEGRYQALLYAEPIVIADPAFYTYAFYVSDAPSNRTGWGDPEYDKLRIQLASTPSEKTQEREAIMKKMGTIVDTAAATLALVNVRNVNVVTTSVKGATPQTNGQIYFNDLGR
ncbi:ABC transporter substrate-binding protein [Pseudarthrobacter sp. SSS035]|uniref:ABC transporter substrate-binding protein n=1 Tax=Pseudarthrobacter sp. SSS035 TaxID=2931399 RepID=UPI00200C21B9|nr:ABC transporter substrate-binding protein [Pseudarthrobacter sp. SSS035]